MNETKISWKIVTKLEKVPDLEKPRAIFNIVKNEGLYKQFGIPTDYCYIPQLFIPKFQFYQKINGLLSSQANISISNSKFPFKVYISKIESWINLNISKIRLYPPNFLALTVTISDIPNFLNARQLIDIQYLHELEPINYITQWTIGLAENMIGKGANLKQAFRTKPAVRIDNVCPENKLRSHFNEKIHEYTGILIRNPDYDQMSDSIPKRIWEKNKYFSEKSSRKILLLNKQGMLYLTAELPKETIRSQPPDFKRTQELYEIALVYDDFVNNFISLKLEAPKLADALLYKIGPWVENPAIIFSSYSYKQLWESLIKEFRLAERIEYITKQVDLDGERNLRNEQYPSYNERTSLRKNLQDSFDETELREICFDFQIDYENLPGRDKKEKVMQLITYFERRRKLSELIDYCKDLRPHISW